MYASSFDIRPLNAEIYEKTNEGTWELVAKVSQTGIETTDCTDRRSFKSAEATIARMRSVIANAGCTMSQFNAVANKEYVKKKAGKQ